jgi:hypothetical protein
MSKPKVVFDVHESSQRGVRLVLKTAFALANLRCQIDRFCGCKARTAGCIVMAVSRNEEPVSKLSRSLVIFALALLSIGATSARADSYQITFTSGLTGVLNLTATPQGGSTDLVTSVTGSENGMAVGGLIAPNSSGFYAMPDGNGFAYDDKLFPNSLPVFDNAGLLFTLIGSGGTLIFENLYSVGSSSYLESAYLSNGAPFPGDFSFVPVTFTLIDSRPVAAPEPSSLALCMAGLVLFIGLASKHRKALA